MRFEEVMKELKNLGTAQNIKIYKGHGPGDNLWGVSFTHQRKTGEKIKSDHDPAKKSLGSKHTDAMILATMVAGPSKMKKTEIVLTWFILLVQAGY